MQEPHHSHDLHDLHDRHDRQPVPAHFRRHARVWLDWPAARAELRLADETQRAAIEAHAMRGLPFVARRRQADDAPGLVPLGLRMPRGVEPRSLSFGVPAHAVREASDALPLAEALAPQSRLPSAWRDVLDQLHNDAAASGITLRVYGSLAWQISTGTQYLAADSDVDLLLRPASAGQAHTGLQLLAEAAGTGAVRIDGELEFPDGRAVAWKELLAAPSQVLAKTSTGVDLISTECIWNQSAWG